MTIEPFAVRFMKVALAITQMERGMTVDQALQVIATENLTPEQIQLPSFTGFINIQQAIAKREAPHITNNLILEESAAPTTNTNFANLRLVVIFPLGEHGFVYIDQHVRRGVISPEIAKRLMQVAEHYMTATTQPDTLEAEMRDYYITLG
ncbi:MAG: hypothetical protein ACOYL5_08990 [Phototrophicaceae bacterium]